MTTRSRNTHEARQGGVRTWMRGWVGTIEKSGGPIVVAILLGLIAIRLRQLRSDTSDPVVRFASASVSNSEPPADVRSALHVFQASAGNVSYCRVFHACRLAGGRMLLPVWMSDHQQTLADHCGIKKAIFVLEQEHNSSSSSQSGQSLEHQQWELNYDTFGYDLLEAHPLRFARAAFAADVLVRLMLSDLVRILHEPVSDAASSSPTTQSTALVPAGLKHSCVARVNTDHCARPDVCSEFLATSNSTDYSMASSSSLMKMAGATMCSLLSRYTLGVLESELLATSSEATWQRQVWNRLQRTHASSQWLALRKQALYIGSGSSRAVCFRSVSTARARSVAEAAHPLRDAGDQLSVALEAALGVERQSRPLGVVKHDINEHPYCLVRVVILVRVLASRDLDELVDTASSNLNEQLTRQVRESAGMESTNSEDDADEMHDIPDAAQLRTVLLALAKRGKKWALRFDVRIARLETLSLDEQISLMQSADIVVGAHHAQLASILFMKRQSAIIEVYPFGCLSQSYRTLASALRVRHYSVISAPDPIVFTSCIHENNPLDSASAAVVLGAYTEALKVYRAHGTPVNLELDEPHMYHANAVSTCAHRQRLLFNQEQVAAAILNDAARQCGTE